MSNTNAVTNQTAEIPKSEFKGAEVCFGIVMLAAAFVGVWGIIHLISSYL